MILDKKQMTEEDIKLNYITPALNAAGWENGVNITMETKITDGRISLKGNVAYCESAKKADYILYLNKYHPIAIVEAKDNKHSISHGLQAYLLQQYGKSRNESKDSLVSYGALGHRRDDEYLHPSRA